MKTKIVNTTKHHLRRQAANLLFRFVPPMGECTEQLDPNATYRDYCLVAGNQSITITSDDLDEAAEITVYETPTQKLEFRISKLRHAVRASTDPPARGSGIIENDSTAFDALKDDASSRMKDIAKSNARLVVLSKQVKICPAQCQNLFQTCLKGVREMISAYDAKSENHLWELYSSKKLGQLVGSLDNLLSTLGSIQDLLQACGSNWCSMALVVSLPLPPPQRITSKFDILLKELHWNLETIQSAVRSNEGRVKFKWNNRKVRYVLVSIAGAKVTVAEDMELGQSRRLASEDREHLLSQLENGLASVPGNPLLYYLWWYLGFKLPTDRWRAKLAAELQNRLKETAVLSCDNSSIPNCFRINIADLKLHSKLTKFENDGKSVWKGEWCGQVVAIRVAKYTTIEAVEKEAGLMLKVQHPNIVGFLGCAFTDEAPPLVRGEEEKCSAGYIVMELMQENLRSAIDRCARTRHPGNPFPLAVTVDILSQIAGAMVHMHNLKPRLIMHRDLKSANCLVNLRSSSNPNAQVVKVIDFDRSKELNPKAPISPHTANTGTRRWMAPEVWGIKTPGASNLQNLPYTTSADVWSFGMICYEVITGLLPFDKLGSNGDLENALEARQRPSIPDSVSCPEGLKALMSRCWAQDPCDRPDFKAIEKDLWTIKYQLEIQ